MTHISLDFWHTLAEPNPLYAETRKQILSEYFGFSPAEAAVRYKTAKREWETSAHLTGNVLDYGELREHLAQVFGLRIPEPKFRNMVWAMRCGFRKDPPRLVSHEIWTLLRSFPEKHGVTLSIGSNTNFLIRGDEIRRLLPEGLFAFQQYSDEEGICKPNPEFFARALVTATRDGRVKSPRDFVHVGDNHVCDVEAPARLGLRSYIVADQNQLLNVLKDKEAECYAFG